MQVTPYVVFEGRAEEAIAFYAQALGAEVVALLRFSDNPEPPAPGMVPPGWESKIMHAQLRIGESTLYLSDGGRPGPMKFEGFSLTLTVADSVEADRNFAALSDGGQVRMPLVRTFFSPRFGMVADRFGIQWMIYVRP